MAKLREVDYDPFAPEPQGPRLREVDYDPFAPEEPDSFLTVAKDRVAGLFSSPTAEDEQFTRDTTLPARVGYSVERGVRGAGTALGGASIAEAQRQLDEIDRTGVVRLGFNKLDEPIEIRDPIRVSKYRDRLLEELGKNAAFVAEQQRKTADIPQRPATRDVGNAQTFAEGWEAFKRDPLGVVGDIGVQSATQMAPGLLAAAATKNPAIAAPIMGITSGGIEFGSGITEFMAKAGVDTSDPEAVRAAAQDPVLMAQARDYASKRGLIIGGIDALTGGAASLSMVPKRIVKNQLAREGANALVAQPTVQALAGAGGEASAQLATEGRISAPGEVLMEALGEGATAPAEVLSYGAKIAATPRVQTGDPIADAGAKTAQDAFQRARAKNPPKAPPKPVAAPVATPVAEDTDLDALLTETYGNAPRVDAQPEPGRPSDVPAAQAVAAPVRPEDIAAAGGGQGVDGVSVPTEQPGTAGGNGAPTSARGVVTPVGGGVGVDAPLPDSNVSPPVALQADRTGRPTDAAGSVAPVVADSGRGGAAPLLDPEARESARHNAAVDSLTELAPELREKVRTTLAKPIPRDRVTGYYRAEELDATVDAAQQSGQPATYVEADLVNLNGLNKALKGTSNADVHYKAIADLIVRNLPEGSVAVRKGGDEMGFVVPADETVAIGAMDKARADVTAYAEAQGLQTIPHTKAGKGPGTGIHYGTAPIAPGLDRRSILSQADKLVEARKEGAAYGLGTRGTAGVAERPAGEAARSAGGNVQPAARGERGQGGVVSRGDTVAEAGAEVDATPASPNRSAGGRRPELQSVRPDGDNRRADESEPATRRDGRDTDDVRVRADDDVRSGRDADRGAEVDANRDVEAASGRPRSADGNGEARGNGDRPADRDAAAGTDPRGAGSDGRGGIEPPTPSQSDEVTPSPSPEGLSTSEARESAKKAWGNKLITRLENAGILKFVTTDEIPSDALKSEDAEGVKGLYHSGVAYVVSDQLSSDEVAGVILHEVGEHYGLERMVGAEEYAAIKARARALRKRGDPDVVSAYNSVPKDTKPEDVDSEAIAYLSEAKPEHTISRRIFDAVYAFLNRLGIGTSKLEGEAAQIRRLVRTALRRSADGVFRGEAKSETKASRRTPQEMAARQRASLEAVDKSKRGSTRMEAVRRALEVAGKVIRAPYESAVDKLRRSPITRPLGDAIAKYFDQTRKRQGETNAILRPVTLKATEDDLRTFERAMRAAQNGRLDEAREILRDATENTRALWKAWADVAKLTGDQNQAVGVKVFDAAKGEWRPIGRVKMFWPRVLQKRFQRAMQNPDRYAQDWAKMVDILVAAGRVKTAEEAASYLNAHFNDETADDYFAGIEKARAEPMPEELYDYSWEQALNYKNNWAERISQIEAFGQEGPTGTDLFTETSKSTLNRSIQEHVQRVADVIYKKRKNRTVNRVAQSASTIATGLQLGNPGSAITNLVGGLTLSGQQFPLRYWVSAMWDMRNAGREITDAFDKGVLVDDFFGLVADSTQDEVPEVLSKITSGLLKYGGFSLAEHVARAQTMLTAKHWLRDSLKSWNGNIKSRKSRLAVAWLQRNGFDYRELLAENGQGPVTDRFFRYAVNDTQGSYRIDQTPTFIDEPLGRFILKYQKFSQQVIRMFAKNYAKPFYDTLTKGGEKATIEVDGKLIETRVANFMPMLRYFLFATAGGLMAQGLRAVLFGYAEAGPDDEEIKKALADNENAKAMGLAIERGFMAQVAMGAYGFVGNYGQALMAWQDRQRYKNPLDPPALAPLDLVGDTLVKGLDQGGLTAKDVDQAIQGQWSMYRTARRLAGTTAMYALPDTEFAKLEQAHRDRAWARKMARRYADETGIEAKKRAPDEPVYTANTPINGEIKEALLVGDVERAKQIAQKHLESFRTKKDIDNAKASIMGSVRAFRPALVFEAQSAYQAEEFKAWAKANLTEQGYARLTRVDDAYMKAAKDSGIWDWKEPKMAKERSSRIELSPDAAKEYARTRLD